MADKSVHDGAKSSAWAFYSRSDLRFYPAHVDGKRPIFKQCGRSVKLIRFDFLQFCTVEILTLAGSAEVFRTAEVLTCESKLTEFVMCQR
jgi:hypothetical protein